MEKLYHRLTTAHEQYKNATTKTQFSNVWVECNQIEQALDAINVYEIKENSSQLRKLRKLMLKRLLQLETKARRRYNLIESI
jgi:hypothetical protein